MGVLPPATTKMTNQSTAWRDVGAAFSTGEEGEGDYGMWAIMDWKNYPFLLVYSNELKGMPPSLPLYWMGCGVNRVGRIR